MAVEMTIRRIIDTGLYQLASSSPDFEQQLEDMPSGGPCYWKPLRSLTPCKRAFAYVRRSKSEANGRLASATVKTVRVGARPRYGHRLTQPSTPHSDRGHIRREVLHGRCSGPLATLVAVSWI